MRCGVVMVIVFITLILVGALSFTFFVFPRIKMANLNSSLVECTDEPWRIPKVIYRVYAYGKGKKLPIQFQKAWDETQRYNPEFEQVLLDDDDCEKFLKQYYYPGPVYDAYHKINPKYGAAKADLFRYAFMYEKGGVYLDMKSIAKKLCRLIRPTDGYILTQWDLPLHLGNKRTPFGEIQQWNIICRPKHPFLKQVLKDTIHNINNYGGKTGRRGVLELTGPFPYTNAIVKVINKTCSDFRAVGPHGNGILIFRRGDHEKTAGKHYSRIREPIVIDN